MITFNKKALGFLIILSLALAFSFYIHGIDTYSQIIRVLIGISIIWIAIILANSIKKKNKDGK